MRNWGSMVLIHYFEESKFINTILRFYFPLQNTTHNKQKVRIHLKASQKKFRAGNINLLLKVKWIESQQYSQGKITGLIQYKNLKK